MTLAILLFTVNVLVTSVLVCGLISAGCITFPAPRNPRPPAFLRSIYRILNP